MNALTPCHQNGNPEDNRLITEYKLQILKTATKPTQRHIIVLFNNFVT